MSYFAIAHTYAGNTRRGDNRQMGLIVKFESAQDRDAWCAAGPDYRSAPRYREALAANDPDVIAQGREGGVVTADTLRDDPYFEEWR